MKQFDALIVAMRTAFGHDDLVVDRGTTAAEVPGWDSLSHVWLMLEVEKVFGVMIQPDETNNLADVGALFDLIIQRVQEKR